MEPPRGTEPRLCSLRGGRTPPPMASTSDNSCGTHTFGSPPRGDTWVLKGVKRWIGNGTTADLIVAWARDTQEGQVKSFMVETPARGYEASVTTGKVSLQ